jgi:hypothetical protein
LNKSKPKAKSRDNKKTTITSKSTANTLTTNSISNNEKDPLFNWSSSSKKINRKTQNYTKNSKGKVQSSYMPFPTQWYLNWPMFTLSSQLMWRKRFNSSFLTCWRSHQCTAKSIAWHACIIQNKNTQSFKRSS